MAYDVVPARANLVKQVRCARGDMPNWGGEGVGAADADGLVHVAHGNDWMVCWVRIVEGGEEVVEGISSSLRAASPSSKKSVLGQLSSVDILCLFEIALVLFRAVIELS